MPNEEEDRIGDDGFAGADFEGDPGGEEGEDGVGEARENVEVVEFADGEGVGREFELGLDALGDVEAVGPSGPGEHADDEEGDLFGVGVGVGFRRRG